MEAIPCPTMQEGKGGKSVQIKWMSCLGCWVTMMGNRLISISFRETFKSSIEIDEATPFLFPVPPFIITLESFLLSESA